VRVVAHTSNAADLFGTDPDAPTTIGGDADRTMRSVRSFYRSDLNVVFANPADGVLVHELWHALPVPDGYHALWESDRHTRPEYERVNVGEAWAEDGRRLCYLGRDPHGFFASLGWGPTGPEVLPGHPL
jgi:hypothetical protein